MLDLHLGTDDGIEQLRFLGEQRYAGAIALMSGFGDRVLQSASTLGRSLGLTIAANLTKPASNAQIRDVLTVLSQHRASGRNGHAVARAERNPSEPLSVARLEQGLSSDELALEFQPIINCATGEVEVLEALTRWRHPERGLVMPDEFIPLAEQDNGLIDRMTQWVVCTASAESQRLYRLGMPGAVAVNISGRNLRSLDFPDRLLTLVGELGSSPSNITLEITETAASDPTVAADILTRLRLKGFRLAMDDFGTGSLH